MSVEKSYSIDAVRGCAIFAVLVFHFRDLLFAALMLPERLKPLLGLGASGVDIFFVLSAFLLTRNLLAWRNRSGAAAHFYRRRVRRIAPLYLALLLSALALIPLLGAEHGQPGHWLFGGLAPWPLYPLFLQNYWYGLQSEWAGSFLAPTWSLAVEEQFYVFLPLLVLRLNARKLTAAAMLAILVAPILRIILYEEIGPLAVQTWTFARVDSFGWGMLVALTLHESISQDRFQTIWRLVAMLVIAGAILLLLFGNATGYTPLGYCITALLGARLTLFAARQAPSQDWKGFLFYFAVWMGRRCYSLYMLHMPVIGMVMIATASMGSQNAPLLRVFCAVSLTFLLADLSFRFIEQPFMRVK